VRQAGDSGAPVVIAHPETKEALALQEIARALAGRISVQSLQIMLPMV
jgi:ATP-binding protein involved in chromosome partitioning